MQIQDAFAVQYARSEGDLFVAETPAAKSVRPKSLSGDHQVYNDLIAHHVGEVAPSMPADHDYVTPILGQSRRTGVDPDDAVQRAYAELVLDKDSPHHIRHYDEAKHGPFAGHWQKSIAAAVRREANENRQRNTFAESALGGDAGAETGGLFATQAGNRRVEERPDLDAAGKAKKPLEPLAKRIKDIVNRNPNVTVTQLALLLVDGKKAGAAVVRQVLDKLAADGEIKTAKLASRPGTKSWKPSPKPKLTLADRIAAYIEKHPSASYREMRLSAPKEAVRAAFEKLKAEGKVPDTFRDSATTPKSSGMFGKRYAKADSLFRYEEPRPPTVSSPKKAPPLRESQIPTIKSPKAEPPPAPFPKRTPVLPRMPSKKVDPWWHDVHDTYALHAGQEVDREPLGGGINGAWKITFAGDYPGGEHHGVWKAVDDDNTSLARSNIPPDNPHGHEAAAWEVAKSLGLDHVPPTIARKLHGQIGSVQRFRPGLTSGIGASDPWKSQDLPAMAAYDLAIGNSDRHMKNFLVDEAGGNRLVPIDHGLSFPAWTSPKFDRRSALTSEFLRYAIQNGVPIPMNAVEWERRLPDVVRALVRNGLTPDQIRGVEQRVVDLADAAKRGRSFADLWRGNHRHKMSILGT